MAEPSILIVDDSELDRKLLGKAIGKKTGYTFLEARSAKDCFEVLGTVQVDLVLLDILMPGQLGTEVLKGIRQQYGALELPVIMVTSRADAADVVEGLRLGANDYLTKPVDFDVAASRITTHLTLARVSRELARLGQVEAMSAMISTYNHEINNPLTIALGQLAGVEKAVQQALPEVKPQLEELRLSLRRVAEIVRKIEAVSTAPEVKFESYAGKSKRVKIA